MLSPVAISVGIHPLHFGFVVVLHIVIELLTPPLGMCLFVVCSRGGMCIERLVRAILPFLVIEVRTLIRVSDFPMTPLLSPKLPGYL